MSQILQGFEINSVTWFTVSWVLAIAIYFKFTRIWTLRNLDLIFLLGMTPAWMFLEQARASNAEVYLDRFGYIWLFSGTFWWLIRMLMDPMLRRRPQLDANINPSGMTVLGTALLAFLTVEAAIGPVGESGVSAVEEAFDWLQRSPQISVEMPSQLDQTVSENKAGLQFGPAWPLLHMVVAIPSRALVISDLVSNQAVAPEQEVVQVAEPEISQIAARTTAILGHVAIIFGLVFAAYWHYGNLVLGLTIAVLYLLSPYTVFHAARTDHDLVVALLLWSVTVSRRPVITGMLLAVAVSAVFFPIALLPLWTAYYWNRGLLRFLMAMFTTTGIFFLLGRLVTGMWIVEKLEWQADGFWIHFNGSYVLPVIVAYVILCTALVFTHFKQRTFPVLIAHTAVIIIATQFWYTPQGGTYILWYLPLVLLIMFRPTLMRTESDALDSNQETNVLPSGS